MMGRDCRDVTVERMIRFQYFISLGVFSAKWSLDHNTSCLRHHMKSVLIMGRAQHNKSLNYNAALHGSKCIFWI
jgi:hypothetical protein